MDNQRVSLELKSLNNLIRRFFELSSVKKEIEQVTGNNGWIIGFLADSSGKSIYQKDIEEHFLLTRSTVSQVLRLMEKKGFIVRTQVEKDARLKKVELTQKAVDIHKFMVSEGKALEKTLTDGFSADDKKALLGYIKTMKENILESTKLRSETTDKITQTK